MSMFSELNLPVQDGKIAGQGHFKDKEEFAVFFYCRWMGENEGTIVGEGDDFSILFDITEDDVELFPALKGFKQISVWDDHYGQLQFKLLPGEANA